MNPTHIFKHPDVKYTLEWNRVSGKYRINRLDEKGNWTSSSYTKEEIESCGWKCHPIALENK